MISVIVPVYNCDKYLNNSIESLISQTIFDQLEIVFVNDGSTDNSEDILQSYVLNHPNMKLYSQCNKGVSAARNLGIDRCNGEYVCFFDADDIAEPELYERLQKLIEENCADIAVVDYSMFFSDGVVRKHRANVKKTLASKDEIMKEFFRGHLICTNPVDKIFKKGMIDNTLFPEGYSIGEDMYFIFQILKKVDRVTIDSTKSLYRYCLRVNSAMKKEFSDKNFDPVILSERMINELSGNELLERYAEANYIHEICKMLSLYIQNKCPHEYSQKVLMYKEIIRNYSLKNAWALMEKKQFIALLLMRYCPRIYIFIYRILRVG